MSVRPSIKMTSDRQIQRYFNLAVDQKNIVRQDLIIMISIKSVNLVFF